MASFRELEAWRAAMQLAQDIYQLTQAFPGEERFGLTSQLRRAAVSVPSNIAEGQARNHRREFLHHLSIARGSLAELETQTELAFRIGYVPAPDLARLRTRIDSTTALVTGLMRSLRGVEG